eukprot:6240862-Prymnesium_polylepis.2
MKQTRCIEVYATARPRKTNALFSRRPANAHGVGARASHPPRACCRTLCRRRLCRRLAARRAAGRCVGGGDRI